MATSGTEEFVSTDDVDRPQVGQRLRDTRSVVATPPTTVKAKTASTMPSESDITIRSFADGDPHNRLFLLPLSFPRCFWIERTRDALGPLDDRKVLCRIVEKLWLREVRDIPVQ